MLIPAWLKDPRRHRAVFVLALPMVFSNVTTPLLGLVDTWVIGHLGQAWFLGGVSVGATFINLLFWLLGFLRMSTTGLTAQAQGADHAEGQLDTLARALGLAIGLGMALLLLLLPFLPAIIALGGGSSEVQTYAGQYVSVRVWSAPAALCNLVIMGWLLGMQDARSPMLLLILGNLVNMVLDAWFVLGLGWQVKGVAAASLLADYSTLGVGFWLVSRHLRRLDPGVWHNAWLRWRQWPALLREAGDLRAPHRVAHYLEDLAATYHKWYNVERVVPMALTDPEERLDDAAREALRIAKNPEPARAAARLKLNDAVRTVIASGLDLLGVTAPDKM